MATQRPAIIVWRWYGHGKDVCTVITDTNEVRFVARDVLLALDQPLDPSLENEPDHTILADHANCITWSGMMPSHRVATAPMTTGIHVHPLALPTWHARVGPAVRPLRGPAMGASS